jgi:hypothetical protein
VWPASGEVLGTLTPTLRWPATGQAEYEVTLMAVSPADGERTVSTFLTSENRLAVPEGTLVPDGAYRWFVSPLGEGEARWLFEGRFSTTTSIAASGLQVSPAVIEIDLAMLQGGKALRVQAPESMDVEIELPPYLTAGGSGRIVGSGTFSVRLELSARYPETLPAAGEGSSLPGEITIRAGQSVLLVPVVIDVSSLGELVRSARSGFDPVLDTPAFANFAEGLLARFTRGTCLGMVLAAESNYLRCAASAACPDCSCRRLRLRSLLAPGEVMNEMNFLHLANLDPQNWSLAVSSLVDSEGQNRAVGDVMGRLAEGRPVPLAILESSAGSLSGERGNLGHAVLAYAAHEFEDVSVIYLYDPDSVAAPRKPLGMFLAAMKRGPWAGKVLRPGRETLEPTEVFVLPKSRVLSILSPVVAQPYSSLDGTLVRELEER